MEDKFQADFAGVQASIGDENDRREKENEHGLEEVKKSYSTHGSKTAKYMTEQVLKVNPSLSNVQVAMLKARA